MKAITAKIISKRYTGIDIRVNNGTRDFTVNIDKKKMTYDDFKNLKCEVRVYTLVKNCCSAKPLALFESKNGGSDLNEIKELVLSIDTLIGDEIKFILEN